MFDIGASELLLTAIVAIVVIGPKDLPLALRTAGRWIGKIRRVSGHFRTGIETMIREAELEEMEKKWRDQNARIMAESADQPIMDGPPALPTVGGAPGPEPASAESRVEQPAGPPPPP